MAPLGWQGQQQAPGGNPQQAGPQQQLSVVTTVWGGVTASTQSGPMAVSNYPAGTNTTMAPQAAPYGGQQAPYPKAYPPQAMAGRQNGAGYNG